jgi:hypothetical protein
MFGVKVSILEPGKLPIIMIIFSKYIFLSLWARFLSDSVDRCKKKCGHVEWSLGENIG